VSFQELATRISHCNNGRYTQDPIAEKLLTRVAMDENLHMSFYRNLVGRAGAGPEPDDARDHRRGPHLPDAGSIIPGFARKAVQIALAGIYDLRVHHDDVVMPLVRQWGLLDLEGLDAEGSGPAPNSLTPSRRSTPRANRFIEQREASAAKKAARTEA
jgi:acyl-[acyl-carrier-protein] desaturase